MRGLQLLIVEEVREEGRAALVVVELPVRKMCWPKGRRQEPGGSVRGERANLKGLVLGGGGGGRLILGCIEAKFCK